MWKRRWLLCGQKGRVSRLEVRGLSLDILDRNDVKVSSGVNLIKAIRFEK